MSARLHVKQNYVDVDVDVDVDVRYYTQRIPQHAGGVDGFVRDLFRLFYPRN